MWCAQRGALTAKLSTSLAADGQTMGEIVPWGAWLLAMLMASAVPLPANDLSVDPAAPLGSRDNPVRADMPRGQQEFLLRLRCPEGDAPAYQRQGSVGPGPHGGILDLFELRCASGARHAIHIDMYHRGYRETGQLPGLTVLPELPARAARGCPPEVPGTPPGSHVFNSLEVEEPANLPEEELTPAPVGVAGRVSLRLIVDAHGLAVPDSIQVLHADPGRLADAARAHALRMQFVPARHHPGCTVPQVVEFRLEFE